MLVVRGLPNQFSTALLAQSSSPLSSSSSMGTLPYRCRPPFALAVSSSRSFSALRSVLPDFRFPTPRRRSATPSVGVLSGFPPIAQNTISFTIRPFHISQIGPNYVIKSSIFPLMTACMHDILCVVHSASYIDIRILSCHRMFSNLL